MNQIKLLLALVGLSLCVASEAAEPGLCKPMCASEKKACRANARLQTDYDREPLFAPDNISKNPYERTNTVGAVSTVESRAREQADTHRRVSERNGKCDTTYLQCVRACDAPAPGATDSVILRPRPETGKAGTAKP
jgi:hypothetical protein